MRTDELDFVLPPELVAQEPAQRRADSRLMRYRRADRSVAHHVFADLPSILRPGDLLVFNDARVLPARFALRKDTGGRVEGLFLHEPEIGTWRVMLKNVGKNPGGLEFPEWPGMKARVVTVEGAGEYVITVDPPTPAADVLARVGRMPLPPYIRREKDRDERDDLDRARYQTVFARAPGAVAAPTAALHFTDQLLEALAARGIERTFVTLHVGMGTFKPVTAETLDAHVMHTERYSIDAPAVEALNRAKRDGRRIVSVGTTAARVLESQPEGLPFLEKSDETGILIRPPYQWKHLGALITNFHLPRSTLIALVAALVGIEEQRRLYRAAIEQRYRFFSYGDGMLIE